ncbi:hypothetical protein IV203_022588 [Nitzschia inconspicua]|uniref:Uncharacterized protein n=1 Tax=Nitzschia inconspicua TaxID=303405 RepID=A0A9K3KJU6_9STRA|nr:hypothetical protein IV203_022588 [Nitzschia inconspicua]
MFSFFTDDPKYAATVVGSILTVVLATVLALYYLIDVWASNYYNGCKNYPESKCDIDSFAPEKPNKIKCALMHKIQVGSRTARDTPIPLECTASTHVDGLYVSRQQAENATDDPIPLEKVLKMAKRGKPPVVVATIRMGFGHHRLAYSACSWALENGHVTIFHDLLNIKSDESEMITSIDALYSKFSRMATELGGPVEKLWGQAMKQGDADALRVASFTAAHLQPLLTAYPKDTPLITTHQLCALVASAAGFTNVVNLVVDNYPQWFLVVPKTLNSVQGPVNYQSFLRMGVPAEELRLAGHWCPAQLVNNIEADCTRRIERAIASPMKPRRLLVPVGGAGAQKTFINSMIEAIQDWIKGGQLQLFLNAGDHKHMKTAFIEVLDKCQLDYEMVTDTQGVRDFQKKLLNPKNEPDKAITLFAFDEYFPAVATTDMLCRVADVLVCKPSELAFYCIPKLHIRRVGDHEADSARRAAEAGDGSLEAREVSEAMRYLELILQQPPDLLISWNEAIIENNKIGTYDGCKNVVAWAVEA